MNIVEFAKKVKKLPLNNETEKLIVSLLKKNDFRTVYNIINDIMEDCMNLTFQLINHINYLEGVDEEDDIEFNSEDTNY